MPKRKMNSIHSKQTINDEAARRRLSGTAHFTNSLAARQRWTKSHSIRAAIISHILDVCGLKQLQDVSADLQPNIIKIYGKQIADFIEIFEKNINPFDENLDKDSLYNIATAKLVPENVVNFLLNIEKNVEDLRKQFITECAEDQFKSPRIDIVFNQYLTPSIKDCERLHRNETTSTVSIGPNQIRHHNFAEPTLLEKQNTTQDDDYDGIDYNGSSDDDEDYEDASVFCDTFTE
ncbi:uncharacterized protein TNCV_3836091 [Trichonephila clavipes]|nr:uncharacterized protein TNCV_3836091 [Trichonephila clavipes]